jgi:hypothetical protein
VEKKVMAESLRSHWFFRRVGQLLGIGEIVEYVLFDKSFLKNFLFWFF